MLPGWLLGEPVVRDEGSALRALAVREEEDSPSDSGEPIIALELPFGLELGRHIGGRPLVALPTIRGLHLSLADGSRNTSRRRGDLREYRIPTIMHIESL